jgi:DNA-binding MarR family transcriptional regulator
MPAQQLNGPIFPPLPVKFQLGLGMLTGPRRVYFHMVRSAGRLLSSFDVTVEQFVVLLCLGDEQLLTQQELVRRCSSDPRSMGKMLDILSAKGWVKRVDHAADRRAWQIVLTPQGRKMKLKMDEAIIPLRERPTKVLGVAESKALRDLMARLADGLDPAVWLEAPPEQSRKRNR